MRFAEFEIASGERELRRDGNVVAVEPKTLDLLLYLIERRHRMVGKEELLDALWPDTHVTMASLTSCMGRLRRVLGDRGDLVKTYHRKGYRFVGALDEDAASDARTIAAEVASSAMQAAASSGRPGFAGRRQELAALRDALAQCRGGHGTLALITGEQGIGKSRLVEELIESETGSDLRIAVGRCFEGDAMPPFWPWVQAIRSCVEPLDERELRAVLLPGDSDLVRLVPELAIVVPAAPGDPALGDSAQARYRLFHQVTSFFRRLAKRRPLLLVIEDAHWCDRASLLLLRYLTRELQQTAMLVAVTYRSEETGEALQEVLPGLHTVPGVRPIGLRGLPPAEVFDLVRALAGDEVAVRIGERICSETDGNPFFVEHLARHLLERGVPATSEAARGIDVPEGVRAVLQQRMDRLGADCRQTLAIAAVIGREFELGLLNAVRADERSESRAVSLEGTLATLEEAIRARILDAPATSGKYRFAHAMLRETIYRALGSGERSRRHRRIAEELERGTAGDERSLSEMADHFVLGVASGTPEQALRYAIGAGRAANARFAFETAAQRFGQALSMIHLADASRDSERIALLISVAEAHWNAGDRARSRAAAELAAELARKRGDAELFARAALACELSSAQRPSPGGMIDSKVDERYVAFVEEALAGLPESDSELRARLLARLGWASYFARDHGERRDRLSREALAMARRVGDFGTLFSTLTERHQALMDPAHAHERLGIAHEMILLAETEGDRQALAVAYGLRAWDTAESGAMRAADADMAVCGRLADEAHQPVLRCRYLLWQAMRAMLEGKWSAAARLANEAYALGRNLDEELAALNLGNQLLTMQVMIGSVDGLESQVRQAVARYPSLPALRAALAHVEMLRGDLTAARTVAEETLADGIESLPWDSVWLITLGLLSIVYARLDDPERAAELYAALLPYRHQNVMLGVNALACFGPTTRALGNLAVTLERWDDAGTHFEEAIAAQRTMGARPWLAYTCLEHARALALRGRESDRALLIARRDEAQRLASELGMPLVQRDAAALS